MLVDLLKQFLHLNGMKPKDNAPLSNDYTPGQGVLRGIQPQGLEDPRALLGSGDNQPIPINPTPVPNTMTPRVPPPAPQMYADTRPATDIRQGPSGARMGANDDIAATAENRDPSTAPMAVSPIQQRVDSIMGKDYGKYVDPKTGQVTYGKDRDMHWSTKDKIGSALLGVLNGAAGGPIGMLQGGLNAGMDRNYLEKRQDQKDLQNLIPKVKYQQEQEDRQQQMKKQELENQYLAVKPQIAQQASQQADERIAQGAKRIDLTAEKNKYDAEYKQNLITLGKTKADNIKAFRDRELELRQAGVDQGDERIKILQQNANTAAQKVTNQNNNSIANRDARAQIQADIRARGRDKVIADATKGFIVAYQKSHEDQMPSPTEIDEYLVQRGFKESPVNRSLLRKSH